MITILHRRHIDRPDIPEGASWYYLGVDAPRTGPQKRDWQSLPDLNTIAEEIRDDYLAFIDKTFLSTGSIEECASPLTEKPYSPQGLFHEICYVQQAAQLAARVEPGKPIILVCSKLPLRDLVCSYVRECGYQCRCYRGWGERLPELLGHLLEVAKHRWWTIKAFAYRKITSSPPDPKLSHAPVSLVWTWLDERNFQTGEFRELYLGDLVERATYRKIHFVYLLRTKECPELVRSLERSGIEYTYLEQLVSLVDACRAFLQSLIPLSTYTSVTFHDMDLTELVNTEQARHDAQSRLFQYYLLDHAVTRLRKMGVEIKEVFYPFENQPWEKIFCRGLAREYPAARRYAYQHTILSRFYVNHFDPGVAGKTELYPHRIYTTGVISTRLLKLFYGDKVVSEKAYRFAYLRELPAPAHEDYDAREKLVVATLPISPATSAELTMKIFAAAVGQSWQVLIKQHPQTSVNISKLGLPDQWPGNIKLVDPSLPFAELLTRAKVVVYVESSTCIEALTAGVPIIHMVPDGDIDLNTVPKELCRPVRNEEELSAAIADCLAVYRDKKTYNEFVSGTRCFLQDCVELP